MTARTTMAELIARVRVLIYDAAGASQHYTDDQIEDALDARRIIVKHAPMLTIETPTSTTVQYKDYKSDPYYEGSITIEDAAFTAHTATTYEYLNGYYTFAADTTHPTLYITGSRYDLYNAAADLVDDWAATLRALIDFTAAGSSFKQTQQIENMERLSRRLRSKSNVTVGAAAFVSRGDTDQ